VGAWFVAGVSGGVQLESGVLDVEVPGYAALQLVQQPREMAVLLRNLGLVTGQRDGRSIIYALYGDHVAGLLDQAVCHIGHLRLSLSGTGDLDERVLDATP
jgi:hypothetical protein